MYQCHFQAVGDLGQVPHLNSLFAHFLSFTKEFELVSATDVKILDSLYEALLSYNDNNKVIPANG